MWQGGPLREIYIGPPISRKQRAPGYFMLNTQGLYVGAYVCDHCREGLYEAATPSTEWSPFAQAEAAAAGHTDCVNRLP